MRFHSAFGFALSFALASGATACSSSSSSSTPPCNENPWECASGQTCWPESASAFACLNAGPGALGATCANVAGSPSCGAGLACFQATSTGTGTCVADCSTTDPSHACTGGAICETAMLGGAGGPSFSICLTPSSPGDGGTTD
jgi:hypothetical protein